MRFFWITCFILCLFFPDLSLGQTIGIRGYMDEDVRGLVGHVSSDKGGGVPYAHVFFMHGKDTIPLVCDAIGSFSWSVARVPDTIQVRVSAVGFKTLNVFYSPKNQGNRLYIRMQQEAIALNEVIITAKKVYMVVKGDTLEYKADAFKTLEGDFVGNLLKKMPGVSYEGGSLSVNGEPIYRVYVNGENLGGSNTVLNNIRADNVKDIQVYDERNKEDQAKGMKYGRRETVMNLVTKQKVDRRDWRNGMFLLGTGWDISEHQTSRFKQKWNLKFNYSVPLRNTYDDPKKNPQKSLRLTGEYTNVGQENDVQKSDFTLSYANMTVNKKALFPKKLYYSTHNTFQNNKNYSRVLDERVYFPMADYATRAYEGYKIGEKGMWRLNTKHSFSYKKVNWGIEFKGEKNEDDRYNRERLAENDTLIATSNMQYRTNNISSAGLITIAFPLAKRISFKSSVDYCKGKTENCQIDTLIGSSQHVYLEQAYDRQDVNWIGSIGYSKTLSLFNLGFGYTYISSMNKEDGKSINHITSQLDTNGTRDYTLYQQTHGVAGSLMLSTRNLYIAARMEVQRLFRNHVERFPYRVQQKDKFWPLLANMNIKGKSSPIFNWDFTYRLNTYLPMIQQMHRGIETSNPMFLYAGNPNLKPQKVHHWDICFNLMSVSNASSLRGGVMYELTDDYIATTDDYFQKTTYLPEYDYTVMAGATLMTSINTKSEHHFSINMDYSKFSGLLESKLSMNGLYTYKKRPSFTQGEMNYQMTHSGLLGVDLTTAFSRKVEFVLNSKTSVSNTQSDMDKASNILNQNGGLTLRISVMPRCKVSGTFSYNYTKNYATDQENGLTNLKMVLESELWKFASLKLEGINLLNRQAGVSYGKSATYTNRVERSRTGRYVMLTFTQKLK